MTKKKDSCIWKEEDSRFEPFDDYKAFKLKTVNNPSIIYLKESYLG